MSIRNIASQAADALFTDATSAPPPADDQRRQLLQTLLTDPAWECAPSTRQRLQAVLMALEPVNPFTDPRGPRMATLPVESDWALLAHELDNYLDFRRLRHVEARMRGCADNEFHFSRRDWEVARQAEQALADYHRHVRDESFVPREADCFRIH